MSRGFKLRDLVYLSPPPRLLVTVTVKNHQHYACTRFKMSSASKKGIKGTIQKRFPTQPPSAGTWLSSWLAALSAPTCPYCYRACLCCLLISFFMFRFVFQGFYQVPGLSGGGKFPCSQVVVTPSSTHCPSVSLLKMLSSGTGC